MDGVRQAQQRCFMTLTNIFTIAVNHYDEGWDFSCKGASGVRLGAEELGYKRTK